MIYHCRGAELAREIPAGSVDFSITDPPYMAKHGVCWSELGGFAAHALKPGGTLLSMIGHTILPEAIAILGAETELKYHWILSYDMTAGPSARLYQRRIYAGWKPVLWYKKSGQAEERQPFVGDVIRNRNYNSLDRRFHKWGQSVSGILALCQHFNLGPGDMVVDPFVGGGSTAMAALALGCDFIGADIDAEAVETTRARMREYQPVLLGG